MSEFPVTLEREDDGRWIASVDTDLISASIYGKDETDALVRLVALVCEIFEERDWDARAAQAQT